MNTGESIERRFSEWILTVRRRIIVVSILGVVLASAGGMFLEFSSSFRDYFSADDPRFLALEALENTYGKSDNLLFMIAPEDGDATSESALRASVWLTERAWLAPYSIRVDSIANFQHTTADGDEVTVRNLVDPETLDDARERARIRATALADPRLAGGLLASDGGVSAVNVTVALFESDQAGRIPEIVEFAHALAAKAERRFPGIDVRLLGSVIVDHTFSKASIESQKVLLPASLAVMAVALTILIRSLAGVAATGLVIMLSVFAAMGLGGWIGLPMSPTTAAAPMIILILGLANCVHLLTTLRQRLEAGDDRGPAIAKSVTVNLPPIFLASLTTMLAFLGMNSSEVPPYRDLGNFVALGVAASFVLSATLLPALLSVFPMRVPAGRRRDDRAIAAIADFVLRRRKTLLWGSAVVVLGALAAVSRNELNDVPAHFFDKGTEFRQDLDFLDERLNGTVVLDYALAAGEPGGVTKPAFLADVSAFADWYREQPETRHVEVITDTFRQLNKSMHGDDPAAYRLPESRDLAAQYLLLYELSLPQGLDLNHRVDQSKSATRMSVTARTMSSREVLELNARAEGWLRDNASSIARAEGAGGALIFAHIGQRNIRALLVGTTITLFCISMILVLILRSLRLGLISLAPNFVPAILGFGVWGLVSGEVSVTVALAFVMTFGIVIDDSVHFLSKYRHARRSNRLPPDEAVRYAFHTVGRALTTTTAVLVGGLLLLVTSPFVPTSEGSLLMAMIIAFALIADFLLLPPLLIAFDRETGTPDSGQRVPGTEPKNILAVLLDPRKRHFTPVRPREEPRHFSTGSGLTPCDASPVGPDLAGQGLSAQ